MEKSLALRGLSRYGRNIHHLQRTSGMLHKLRARFGSNREVNGTSQPGQPCECCGAFEEHSTAVQRYRTLYSFVLTFDHERWLIYAFINIKQIHERRDAELVPKEHTPGSTRFTELGFASTSDLGAKLLRSSSSFNVIYAALCTSKYTSKYPSRSRRYLYPTLGQTG